MPKHAWRKMFAALDAAGIAAREAGVPYYADPANRASAARDFGGIAEGSCLLLAEPATSESCQALVGALAHRNLGCTLRGGGYSQSGQSVALDTVSLSTRRLDWIGRLDPATRTVAVGAGTTLRRLLSVLLDQKLLPPVLPLNLDMTVGGLLSAGGIGPTSHRHGPVIANVMELEVVTGDGARRSCTRQQNADLFNAVLGGVGQGGLMTRATLHLSPAPQRLRTFLFLYDDIAHWLEDQLAATTSQVEFHIEGFCWAAAKGTRSTSAGPSSYTHWMYGLQLAVDTEAMNRSDAKALLSSLRPERELDEHETNIAPFLQRYEPRFAGLVQSGAWNDPHPWFEGIVPLDGAADVLLRVLELLPAEVGDGHRFTLLKTEGVPRYFMCPAGRLAGVIGIFPATLARSALPKILRTIESLTGLIVECEGRRYLSGWLGTDASSYLRAHFGNRFDEWLDIRRRYDPGSLFRSSLFTQGNCR